MADTKAEYYLIDVLKLFFSICIVALHTNLFLREYPALYWYFSHVIWRIAVPFFFISSGYFFCQKVKASSTPHRVLKNAVKRLLILFCFWLCITLPLEINTLMLKEYTIMQMLTDLIKRAILYPWGALWYLLALILAYLFIYPFIIKKSYKLPLCLGACLFSFALICNSYYFIIENTFVQGIADGYLELFISARNGIFLGFFYVAIANYLTVKKPFSKKGNILLLCIGLVSLFLEAAIIRGQNYKDDHSLFLSLPIVTLALFELAKSYTMTRSGKQLRNLSIGIYVLHRPVLGYLDYFLHLSKRVGSITLFFIVLLLTAFLVYLLQRINHPFIKRIIT